ncbi:GNAT family N-acetyltransferase [Mangrovibacillus cuniculi]|uniref:GNAT family N-acetyltransferase n=1 Tax=Mangrovibacillus cuniculi TaxID=2593652 RepID=UPI001EFA1D84|nr:GNAT family N-acetyltransferase [Mangrovibacillus cuniculi]
MGKENNHKESLDLTSLYVLQEYQGLGLGKKLLMEIFTHISLLGFNKVFVDVLEDNPTCKFYEYLGAEFFARKEIEIAEEKWNLVTYLWGDIRVAIGILNR